MTILSEAAFTGRVIGIAKTYGWRVAHFRPARTQKGWRTPMEGDIGVPDLILARDGDVLLAELKTNSGVLLPDQQAWLDHLGPHGCVWRPRDHGHILARLARTVTA